MAKQITDVPEEITPVTAEAQISTPNGDVTDIATADAAGNVSEIETISPAGEAAGEEEMISIPKSRYDKIVAAIEALNIVTQENPEMAKVIELMTSGDMGFLEAIGSVVEPADLQAAIDEAESGTPFAQRVEERSKKKADEEKASHTAVENMAKSLQNVQDFCVEKGLTEEETVTFSNKVIDWFQIFADGKLTKDDCNRLFNMVNYDSDVETAFSDGMNAGRSEKTAKRRTAENKDNAIPGVGIVGNGGGGNVVPSTPSPSISPIEEAMNIMGSKRREL